MSLNPGSAPVAFLEVQGTAADHLYREGSAKASFWEALFGSSLRVKTRTLVSARADGTRVFDVPLLGVEDTLLRSAHLWMNAAERSGACREAAAVLAERGVRVKLIGLQPRGTPLASFAMRFEPVAPAAAVSPGMADAFRSWFEDLGPAVTRDTLAPFGFTPLGGEGLKRTP